MANKAWKATELMVTTKNEVGALAKVTKTFTDANVNIESYVCYTDNTGNNATFHFVTNNNNAARTALTNAGYTVDESEVVCLTTPNTPGGLNRATLALAEAGVNTNYTYCTTVPGTNTCTTTWNTNNNNTAWEVFKKF